jgi:hypothetical protein
MNKKILDRLRKSFKQLEEGNHLPRAPRRVVESSDPGLAITSFGEGGGKDRKVNARVSQSNSHRKVDS